MQVDAVVGAAVFGAEFVAGAAEPRVGEPPGGGDEPDVASTGPLTAGAGRGDVEPAG